MPGLVGIIGKGFADERQQELGRMLDRMFKKDRLESETYVDEERGVYVGWTCHKNAYADCLPIKDSSGDAIIFFAGEHFAPDGEGEARLASQHGCSRDNATVLLPLYRKLGAGFFPYLNGFFHGLIIDHREERIILFNDRFGMQRLYIYEEPEAFYFASEAKSLLAIRSGLRSFDLKSLGEWLSCGCVLENRSLFRGINALPGGSRWVWGGGLSCEKTLYFSPGSWESQAQLDTKSFYQALQATFAGKLPGYLRSEGQIGMSVTGGLDTRMILANIMIDKDLLRCYTFSGPVRENLDVTIGRRVALAAGFEHTTLTIDKDFFNRFDGLARDFILSTDGNLELSGVPEFFLNEMSRAISPVRLTGNYGSEVLRRYHSFKPTDSICGVFNEGLAESVKKAKGTWARAKQAHPLTYVVFKQIPWFSYNRLQSEQAVLTMRSPFMDNALLKVIYQAPPVSTESNLVSLRLIYDGNPRLGAILTDRGVSYPKRLSYPLTRAYYEFIFKMEYYASHGMPRGLASLDTRLGPLSLERNFLGRNKYYHYRQWFRDELAFYVRNILLDEGTLSREYLDRPMVIEAVKKHLAGTENNTDTIDKLITLELINRLLLGVTYP
jgi:asparagine synthase (glutamine-hydrolysing)